MEISTVAIDLAENVFEQSKLRSMKTCATFEF
jgi:hypothetical protein